MRLKPGVRLKDLTPQMALAASAIARVFYKFGAECTITSANDSKHMDTSLHYKGCALDFRIKDYQGDKRQLAATIKAVLGDEFDVVLEDPTGENQHIHVEWDPKERP